MDFAFFAKLSEQEAADYLRRFLRAEAAAMPTLVTAASELGIAADFSLGSLTPMLRWLVGQHAGSWNAEHVLPPWAVVDEDWCAGAVELADVNRLVLRGGFYLGESFVRHAPARLRWASGDRDTVLENQPVVVGFAHKLELAPVLVVENLFRRTALDRQDTDVIPITISEWVSRVPRT